MTTLVSLAPLGGVLLVEILPKLSLQEKCSLSTEGLNPNISHGKIPGQPALISQKNHTLICRLALESPYPSRPEKALCFSFGCEGCPHQDAPSQYGQVVEGTK